VPSEWYQIPLGKAALTRQGDDVTVIAYGSLMPIADQAATLANARGIGVDLIDLRTLWPLDLDTILSSLQKTGRCVVVHEAPKTAGFGCELLSLIQDKAFFSLKAPIRRVTGFDTAVPLYRMENYFLPNGKRILHAIQQVMAF